MLPYSPFHLCLIDFTPHSRSFAMAVMRCFCKHIRVSANKHYHHDRISTFIIIHKHSQNSKFSMEKSMGTMLLLFKCACETHRLPVFKQSRKLPYVVFVLHFCSILSTVTNIPIKTQIVSSNFRTSSMRVGLAGFRPCTRFHSSCVTSAIAYAVSAFSFVSIRFFYIAVTLFCC